MPLRSAALALAALAASSAAAEPQADLQRIEREIETGRQRAQELASQAQAAQAEARRLRERLVAAAAALRRQEEAVAEVETHLAALAEAEAVRRGALETRRQELSRVLEGLVRLSRRPAAALLASQSSPLDAYRGARLMGAAAPALEAEAQALRGELEDLLRLRDEIAAERDVLARAQAAAAAERETVERLLAEKSIAQARFRAQRAAEEKRVAALAGEAKDLRTLVRRLAEEAEEEARRKAEDEALRQAEEAHRKAEAEEARQRMDAEARHAADEQERARREAERRTLAAAKPAPSSPPAMPALGRLIEAFGEPDRFGQPSRGIRLETKPRAQVVSPRDGRIVFAGPFRGYGLLLILAHDDGYHSLLAGMSRLHGSVGQQVLAGEPVGEMGEADPGPPTLYVELRRGGEPVNPSPWLAAGKGKVSG